MNKETIEVLKLAQWAKTVLILGYSESIIPRRLLMGNNRIVHDEIELGVKYDLIIANTGMSRQLSDSLNAIADDGYIFVTNYGNVVGFDALIDEFVHCNLNNLQVSRQMMVDGSREKHLILRYNSQIRHVSERTDPITILLVLRRGGGVYDEKYVNATARSIKANITYPHELVCLTESSQGITDVDRVIEFRHDWPKWWGKVELFRHDITQNKHCMFIDLDTVICSNIDKICRLEGEFFGIRDFYNISTLQTGIMKWEVGEQSKSIYDKFITEDFSKYKSKGDHEWIGSVVSNYNYIQDCMPGALASYKKHLSYISRGMMNPDVICFHGDPRPHTVTTDIITRHWIYQ